TITLNSDLILGVGGAGTSSDAGSALDGAADSNPFTVTISKILYSCAPVTGDSISITRNSLVVATLFGSGELDLSAKGIVDTDQATHDIVVTFTGSGGTVYLKLKKATGYGD